MPRRFFMTICATASLGMGAASADELRDYGEYLAGECTTCHRLDGVDKGIPSIVGLDIESFTTVLKAYQTGDLTNPAMVSVARSLDDEQIKALATYFSSIKPKEAVEVAKEDKKKQDKK